MEISGEEAGWPGAPDGERETPETFSWDGFATICPWLDCSAVMTKAATKTANSAIPGRMSAYRPVRADADCRDKFGGVN